MQIGHRLLNKLRAIRRGLKNIVIFLPKFIFAIKYPFFRRINNDTGKRDKDYLYTWYDYIPRGWQKAFGKDLAKELKKALKEDGTYNSFDFYDIKEKYGTLRLDAYSCTDKVDEILRKYEYLSYYRCQNCGKPIKYQTQGWIGYYCDKCIVTLHKQNTKRSNSIRKRNKEPLVDWRKTFDISNYKRVIETIDPLSEILKYPNQCFQCTKGADAIIGDKEYSFYTVDARLENDIKYLDYEVEIKE